MGSFEEAWLAVMCNTDIQAVVMRQTFPARAERPITSPGIRAELDKVAGARSRVRRRADLRGAGARACATCGPELDLYLLTNESLSRAPGRAPRSCSRASSTASRRRTSCT